MTTTAELRLKLDQLSERDRPFALSLIESLERRKAPPSDKQAYWIEELARRAAGSPAPARRTETIGDLAGLLGLFDTAASHLKRPAIVFGVDGVGEVKLSLAGPAAKVPGSINVADNAPYGAGRWFGRIRRDGTFEGSFRAPASDELIASLKVFSADPVAFAARHGHLTGKCCFCNTALTDERSTAVGYGPVCAKHYGLPWGDKQAAAAPAERQEPLNLVASYGSTVIHRTAA